MTAKKLRLLDIPSAEQGTLASLLKLSGNAVKGLESALLKIEPTLVQDLLIAQLKQEPELAEVEDLGEIVSALINVAGTAYGAGVTTDEVVDLTVATIRNDDVVDLSDDQANTLRERLKSLEKLVPIELVAKGGALLRASERTFHSARIYSDLRPICIGEETEVAGAVVVHQLAIRSTKNNRREYTYFMLDSTDLAEVQQVIARAIKKDRALRELAACSKTPVLSPPME